MPAYVIVGVDVTEPEAYTEYARGVPATLEPFGGVFVVRGGAFEILEGDWQAPRIVLIRFPLEDRLFALGADQDAPSDALVPSKRRSRSNRLMPRCHRGGSGDGGGDPGPPACRAGGPGGDEPGLSADPVAGCGHALLTYPS